MLYDISWYGFDIASQSPFSLELAFLQICLLKQNLIRRSRMKLALPV